MRSLEAHFSVVDDLLTEAALGRLRDHGSIIIEKSDRIGPVVELLSAAARLGEQYQSISLNGEFATQMRNALATGISFGGAYLDKAGVFPLPSYNPVVTGDHRWEQWLLHAENVARANGLAAPLVASLIGALKEMQDNVYEHSGAPQTGLVAYAVTDQTIEFVVSDRGRGVLETLRENPNYAHLPDAGAALEEAIKPGVSRFPIETGRGQGYVQLYRAMVTHRAELRFRSGDHALTLRPTADPLHAQQELGHAAALPGLTISAFWRKE